MKQGRENCSISEAGGPHQTSGQKPLILEMKKPEGHQDDMKYPNDTTRHSFPILGTKLQDFPDQCFFCFNYWNVPEGLLFTRIISETLHQSNHVVG